MQDIYSYLGFGTGTLSVIVGILYFIKTQIVKSNCIIKIGDEEIKLDHIIKDEKDKEQLKNEIKNILEKISSYKGQQV